MKIVVCVKQVGVLSDKIEFIDDQRRIDPDTLDWEVNEWDLSATELALRIQQAAEGAEVVVVSAGPPRVEVALRRTMAMGADRAIRVAADDIDLLDPLTVASLLADAIASEQPDLVLVGAQSSDFAQSATGTALAPLLNLPCVSMVTELDLEQVDVSSGDAQSFLARRELDGGMIEVVGFEAPVLVTVQTGVHQPRYATLRAIKQSATKPLQVIEPQRQRLGGQSAGGYQIERLEVAPIRGNAEFIEGSPDEIAARIAAIIKLQTR